MEEEVLTAPQRIVTRPQRQRQEQREQRPALGKGATKYCYEAFFGAKPRPRQATDWNAGVT
jgi:hypothetical protein